MNNYQEQYNNEIKKLNYLFNHINDNKYIIELLQTISILLSCGVDLQDKKLDKILQNLKVSLWYILQIIDSVEDNLKVK